MQTLRHPPRGLVILVGFPASGKSALAERLFPVHEVVRFDDIRTQILDSHDNPDEVGVANAWALYLLLIESRLRTGRLVIADARHLAPEDRALLRSIAKKHNEAVKVVCCRASAEARIARLERRSATGLAEMRQFTWEDQALLEKTLSREGPVQIIDTGSDVVAQSSLFDNTSEATGWDIIADLHGSASKLDTLLERLGYQWRGAPDDATGIVHPEGRQLGFVGDYINRGIDSLGVLRRLAAARRSGAEAVLGNHDAALVGEARNGTDGDLAGGLSRETLKLLDGASDRTELLGMLEAMPLQRLLRTPGHVDILLTHAGLPRDWVGRDSTDARWHALRGHMPWVPPFKEPAAAWEEGYGEAKGLIAVYGHWTRRMPRVSHGTVGIDCGAYKGGALAAFRYPESEIVNDRGRTFSVSANDLA